MKDYIHTGSSLFILTGSYFIHAGSEVLIQDPPLLFVPDPILLIPGPISFMPDPRLLICGLVIPESSNITAKLIIYL